MTADLEDAVRYATGVVGGRVDYEDILQETVVKALSAGHSVEDMDRPLLFVYARNAAIDLVRKATKELAVAYSDDRTKVKSQGAAIIRQHPSKEPDPEEAYLRKEMTATIEQAYLPFIRACMDRLTEPQRMVAEQYYLEGLDMQTIGKVLGMTHKAVRRNMEKLRATLGADDVGDLLLWRAYLHPDAKLPRTMPQRGSERLRAVFS